MKDRGDGEANMPPPTGAGVNSAAASFSRDVLFPYTEQEDTTHAVCDPHNSSAPRFSPPAGTAAATTEVTPQTLPPPPCESLGSTSAAFTLTPSLPDAAEPVLPPTRLGTRPPTHVGEHRADVQRGSSYNATRRVSDDGDSAHAAPAFTDGAEGGGADSFAPEPPTSIKRICLNDGVREERFGCQAGSVTSSFALKTAQTSKASAMMPLISSDRIPSAGTEVNMRQANVARGPVGDTMTSTTTATSAARSDMNAGETDASMALRLPAETGLPPHTTAPALTNQPLDLTQLPPLAVHDDVTVNLRNLDAATMSMPTAAHRVVSPTTRRHPVTTFTVSSSSLSQGVPAPAHGTSPTVTLLHPKSNVKTSPFAHQFYRLVRFIFLRRWTWQIWRTWARVVGHDRRISRSGEEEEEGDDYHNSNNNHHNTSYYHSLNDEDTRETWREDLGDESERVDGDRGGFPVGSVDRSSGLMDGRGLPSSENTTELLRRTALESYDDDNDGSGGLIGGGGGGHVRGGANSSFRGGTTRRRGRGSAVSPVGGVQTRERRRGRQPNAVNTANNNSNNNHVYSNTATGGGVSAYYRDKNLRDWSVAEMARFFLMFLCCCCCCPGGPLYPGQARVARVLHPFRVLWTRYRTVVWGLLITFLLLNWFVVLPLLNAAFVALLENEEVFVQRMVMFGLPRELDPVTTPKTVVVQVGAPQTLSAAPSVSTPIAGTAATTTNGQTQNRKDATTHNVELGKASVAAAHLAGAVAEVRLRANDIARQSLDLTFAQRHFPFRVPFTSWGDRTVQSSQLPSWTLHAILPRCEECIEADAYDAAVAAAPAIVPLEAKSPLQHLTPKQQQQQQLNPPQQRPSQHRRVVHPSPTPIASPVKAVEQGVYAASTAPLGRIGPMLLAMSSVTDDISLAREVHHWPWLPRVAQHAGRLRAAQQGAAPPYLAVLGIPSTDQPARRRLREAQRATWMSYSEVARSENEFRGRLLALYVFAASERRHVRSAPHHADTGAMGMKKKDRDHEIPSGAASVKGGKAASATASVDGYVSRDAQRLSTSASLLLPTVSDYTAAAEMQAVKSLLATLSEAERKAVVDADALQTASPLHYTQRRMTLRRDWQQGDGADSPCEAVIEHTISLSDVLKSLPGASHQHNVSDSVTAAPATAFLARHLELPVTPLFTTPAQFICYASTALWQEALTHRNVLWIDLLMDRQPTTSLKKLGGEGKWSLPVEVGMSQKLILWLSYAYHAFPDVSFIIKGDDDTYLKVPQYINDITYIQRGRTSRGLSELSRDDDDVDNNKNNNTKGAGAAARGILNTVRRAFASPTPTPNYLTVRASEECVYWGSMRRWNGEVYFGAGMLFLLHRRLVQSILEDRPEYNNDVVRLAAQPYQPMNAHVYFAAMMDHEDVMLGKMLAERRVRGLQLCPYRRTWYVWEQWNRFHDVRRGRAHNVTWSTVAAHRCTPVDFAYLHYYFHHEFDMPNRAVVHGSDANTTTAVDPARAAAGAEAQSLGGDVVGHQQAAAWVVALQRARGVADPSDPTTPAAHAAAATASTAASTTPGDADAAAYGDERVGFGVPLDVDVRSLTAADLPDVMWTVPRNLNHTPLPHVRSAKDGVAVYEVEYSPFTDGLLVVDGWVSNTRVRSEKV